MQRIAYLLLLALMVIVGGALEGHASKRVALVIGNSAYESAPVLKNPRNDAEAISAVLQNLGFDVVKGYDLAHLDFARIVGQFRKKLKGADVGLFFYAGHGMQVNGFNYLVPVDAVLGDETSLDFEAVPLHIILKLMERSTKTNLVFLDACRDNPLSRNLARSMGTRSTAIGQGLARVESGLGTLIAFATQPGNVALDGGGKNSPFATGMLKHMETPGLDVALVMRRVREDVIKATSGSQVPWSNSSLTGSFMFNDKPLAKTPVTSGMNTLAIELAYWEAAKEAGTRQGYEVYLRKYPNGNFAPLVAMKLEALKGQLDSQKTRTEETQVAVNVDQDPPKTTSKRNVNPAAAAVEVASVETAPAAKMEVEQHLDAGELTVSIQQELGRLGCSPGTADGDWGRRTRNAMSRFNRYASLDLDIDKPSEAALPILRMKTGTVCPVPAKVITTKAKKVTPKKKVVTSTNKKSPAGSAKKKDLFGGETTRLDCERAITAECF